ARRAELAPIAMLELHVPGRLRRGARLVVVVSAQKVERARTNCANAFVAAGIDDPGPDEKRDAVVVELAIGEVRPAVADEAVAAADKKTQAALGRLGIT